jgi:tetratricopeptide (TPR) repeat protein
MQRRELAAAERRLGPNHPEVADQLFALAETVRRQGRLQEAERLYWRAYMIRSFARPQERFELGRILGGLAELANAQGRLAEAESLSMRAIAAMEPMLRSVLGRDRLYENPLNSGMDLTEAPQDTWALRAFGLPISARERLRLGEEPEFARRLENLADLYLILGRRAEADSLYRRSSDIRERHAASKR